MCCSRRNRTWLASPALVPAVVAALALLVLAVFLPVVHHGFVEWDDPWYVTRNEQVRSGLSWSTVQWALTTGSSFYWHPLTWMSHMLDVELFGMNAGGHHVTNLILHLATTLLLFAWLKRATAAPGRSAFVAALFAVHPAHVESVAWVAERKDVLSTLFLVLTCLAYHAYCKRPGWLRYGAVLVTFVLGLAAKPMLVTLPILLLLLDVWPYGRWTRDEAFRLVREKVPFLLVSLVVAALTIVNQADAGALRSVERFPLDVRIENAMASLAKYLATLVWPVDLAAFYPYPRVIEWATVFAGLAVLVFGTVAVAWHRRTRPYLLVGWTWYLVTLLPVIGLVQVGDQGMADRFTYVPFIGLFIMLAWGLPELVGERERPRRALAWAGAGVVCVLALLSRQQVSYWTDSETMWSHAAAVTADNEYAHANLGRLKEEQGQYAEAVREYEEAARIADESPATPEGTRPGAARLHNQSGILHMRQDQVDEAIEQFRLAIARNPGDPSPHHNLGVALEQRDRIDEAIVAYREAARLAPNNAETKANLSVLLARQGHLDEAIPVATEALSLDPAKADWHYNLGVMLEQAGRTADAVRQYHEVLRLRPGDEPARQALQQLTAPR